MLVDVEHGNELCRFKNRDLAGDVHRPVWGYAYSHIPPVKVGDRSEGQLVCFVLKGEPIKPLLHPLEIFEAVHILQSMDVRTDR